VRAIGRAALALSAAAVSGACRSERAPTENGAYVAGETYSGANGYIEYLAGNAPIILSAPHGGALTPASIPDRTAAACGGAATTVTDTNTEELVRQMRARIFARYGVWPHVIISKLSRRKLDPNRQPTEAACGNAEALAALTDWHRFIDVAKQQVLEKSGRGWYMDVHGHGHPIARLELGYLLSATDLDRTDAALDALATAEQTSSVRLLSVESPLSFSTLLRGTSSLGALYEAQGYPSIPSPSDPQVNGTDYFNGGDNTARHSCSSGAAARGGLATGRICGVQLEAHFTGVRDNAANRTQFADRSAVVLEAFLRTHWGLQLTP
jgi:hypothetical protein